MVFRHSFAAAAAVVGCVLAACSGSGNSEIFQPGASSSGGSSGTSSSGGASSSGAASSSGQPPCEGLACKQDACNGGAKTTLTGKVYDPAGVNPLAHVIVYVPKDGTAPLPALPSSTTSGVACETCSDVAVTSDTRSHRRNERVPC